MFQVTFYHYTNFGKIGGILGKWKDGSKSGLEPRERIGNRLYPPTLAIFALLEPTPSDWIENPHFPLTWKALKHNLGVLGYSKLLLEIDINPKGDQVYVADRAHIEGALYEDKTGIPKKYLHESVKAGEETFMTSMVRLEEYLEHQSELAYSLPEVLILQHLPLERIRVSTKQPLIEEDLERLTSHEREYLINLITMGYAQKELAEWRERYEIQHGSLEISRGKKESF